MTKDKLSDLAHFEAQRAKWAMHAYEQLEEVYIKTFTLYETLILLDDECSMVAGDDQSTPGSQAFDERPKII